MAATTHFNYVMFSSGGFSALVYLGVLRYIQQEGINIQHAAGTSMGGVFALMYTLGIDSAEIEKRIKEMVQQRKLDIKLDWMDWLDTGGFDNGDMFVRLFDGLFPLTMTFLDHAKQTGKHLVICTTSLTTLQPVYFSVDTAPNVLITDALKASCAIPGFIKPIKIGNEHYIDGAVVMNLPLQAFGNVSPDEMLVVLSHHNTNAHDLPAKRDKYNAFSVVFAAISAIRQNLMSHNLLKRQYKNHITFPRFPIGTVPYSGFDTDVCTLDMTTDQLDESIEVGYCAAFEFFKQKRSSLQP